MDEDEEAIAAPVPPGAAAPAGEEMNAHNGIKATWDLMFQRLPPNNNNDHVPIFPPRANQWVREPASKTKPTLRPGANDAKSIVELFDVFMPMDYMIKSVLPRANEVLADEGSKALDQDELFMYLSINCLIAMHPTVAHDQLWAKTAKPGDVVYELGRHGMSRDRHKALNRAIVMALAPDRLDVNDPHCVTREFIAAWNDNMATVYQCSDTACLDESIVIWTAQTMSGKVKIPGDPPSQTQHNTQEEKRKKLFFLIFLF
jgi:hypothetical protein